METIQKDQFYVVGISVRTSNENQKAKEDIPMLWNQFMTKDMKGVINNRIDDTICAVYTNYESDHTKPYDTVLGFRVSDLDNIPDGMVGIAIENSSYQKFLAQGDLTKDVVVNKWKEIWGMDLNRKYTADFELYGEKAKDPSNGEVEIFIAIS
ncbi:Predicted transcriptional regulator YdeE, contains AraC-type DNA-binding domain [Tenacibaculum sp. MAR_2009_124]|uniref:GyrI-like domain-containing protein n=1 Tax=Tenacibaculum sp. MAR_2009_124 TaxID=1250059 RepID=UPI0008947B78|nr:GyrI-like domain-containing protein [Tenacibaculum sp. MAR_2009_124]SEB53708.1 Predicted transcriptional regulator YdeE, contains AraC-type DNA-binding domain [Tenacibaculum sp. MAR_2009_124]